MKKVFEDSLSVIYQGAWQEIIAQLQGVDYLLSDPPYGINFVKGKHGGRGNYGGKKTKVIRRSSEKVIGDNQPFDPRPFLHFKNVLLWGANHYMTRLPEGKGIFHVWDKLGAIESFDSFSDAEFAWQNKPKAASRIFRHQWKGIVRKSEIGAPRYHPFQKPVDLMKWCIKLVNKPTLILDPFAGAGSTILAARELGIQSIGIEVDAGYCTTMVDRIRGNKR